MKPPEPIEPLLERLERSLHQLTVRKSAVVSRLLAGDFVEFGSSGRVLTKAQIVAGLPAGAPAAVTVSEFKVRWLAPQLALVTYRAARHTRPRRHTLRSSLWAHRQGTAADGLSPGHARPGAVGAWSDHSPLLVPGSSPFSSRGAEPGSADFHAFARKAMNLEIKLLSDCPEQLDAVGAWIYEEWWRKPDNTREVVLEWLRPHAGRAGFPFTVVAIADGVPVGSCSVIEHDCADRPHYTPWVAAVYVKPDQRRKGVASRVLQKAFRVARGLGIEGLYIDCWAKTAPVYAKSGWSILEWDVGQKDSVVMFQSTRSRPAVAALSAPRRA